MLQDGRTYLPASIIMLSMGAADLVSRAYSGQGNGTMMRDNAYPADWPRWATVVLSRMYALAQFLATSSLLYYNADQIFLTLLPIQLAPLLMTLEKKGFLGPVGWHVGYSLSLLANPLLATGDVFPGLWPAFVATALAVCLGRLMWGCNKYVLWSVAGAVSVHLRAHADIFISS